MKENKITPVVPKNKKYLVKTDARKDIYCIPMKDLYNNLEKNYELTTSYSLKNKQEPGYLSGKNSIINRIYRLWNEKYVIIEQNNSERINIFFTIILIILTILLIYYANKYDLTLAPKYMIKDYTVIKYSNDNNLTIDKDKINEENKTNLNHLKNLQKYKKIQLSSDIIKGISVSYIIILSGIRIFKRTTI
jgi:hypothetical protein